ncbi:hypothetical protein GDO81_027739 [Engystomops pustulosus]|uniref:SURF1-like protein n=1 Tax=Engystomops pustulosus TaxID=76066 RepID=A0AAV6ZP52_ENGPU|nr:hypothetical protein GDO81_027739 [Engystomops pustulosus]
MSGVSLLARGAACQVARRPWLTLSCRTPRSQLWSLSTCKWGVLPSLVTAEDPGSGFPRYHSSSTVTRKDPLVKWLLLLIPVASFGLGTWQIQRRKWKLKVIQELEAQYTSSPIPLPPNPTDLQSMEFHPVTVRGHFDHSKELYLKPRTLVKPSTGSQEAAGMGPQEIGAHVITPFFCSDLGITILVNRGFVPNKKLSPQTRSEGQIEGDLDLVGIVRLTENRQQFSPENDVQKNVWYYRDLAAMAERSGAEPIYIEAVYDTTVPGGPIGGQTRVALKNDHLQYSVTWFSLSAFTSLLWYQKFIRK